MTDRHEFTLRIPEFLFKIMDTYKNKTGVSINAQISQSIVKDLFLKGLVTTSDFREKPAEPTHYEDEPIFVSQPPMYCDGDKCEIPMIKEGC